MKDIDGYVTKDNLYRVISRIKYKPDIVIDNTTCNIIIEAICAMPKADIQPLSVVAEHIKNRLYETAFNTDDRIASDAIADMAERIDFWIDELKDGDTNG